MWGTDYPISLPSQTYAQTVSLYRDHMPYLTPAAHQQILSTTVQKVWPFA
jgi:L-fuconolactonase